MGLCYTIIICLVLAEAHMWILGDPGAALIQLWSCHLLFISFGKYCCITMDAKIAVPLNGRRNGLFSDPDNPPPQFDPPKFSAAGSIAYCLDEYSSIMEDAEPWSLWVGPAAHFTPPPTTLL